MLKLIAPLLIIMILVLAYLVIFVVPRSMFDTEFPEFWETKSISQIEKEHASLEARVKKLEDDMAAKPVVEPEQFIKKDEPLYCPEDLDTNCPLDDAFKTLLDDINASEGAQAEAEEDDGEVNGEEVGETDAA